MFSVLVRMPSYKLRRQGVPDHQCDRLLSSRCRKFILRRESLEQRSFPKSDRPIFGRVNETPLGRIVASARDGRRDVIPSHSSVDVPISGFNPFMALQPEPTRYIRSGPTVFRDERYYFPHPFASNFRQIVQLISAFSGGRQRFDEVSYRSTSLDRRWTRNDSEPRRFYQHPSASLRHTVIRRVFDLNRIFVDDVSDLEQFSFQNACSPVFGQRGNVLQHYGLRQSELHESEKLEDQLVPLVFDGRSSIPRSLRRESLAGRASSQQIQLPPFYSKVGQYLIHRQVADVAFVQLDSPIVQPISRRCHRIVFDPCQHPKSRFAKPDRQSSRSAE